MRDGKIQRFAGIVIYLKRYIFLRMVKDLISPEVVLVLDLRIYRSKTSDVLR
ncbi:hypothetical protein V6Z12_D11G050200 [Gossypium hirsutum]